MYKRKLFLQLALAIDVEQELEEEASAEAATIPLQLRSHTFEPNLRGNVQGCVRIPLDSPITLREDDAFQVRCSDPGPNRVWNGKVVRPFSEHMLMIDIPVLMWAPCEMVPHPKDNTKQKVIVNE